VPPTAVSACCRGAGALRWPAGFEQAVRTSRPAGRKMTSSGAQRRAARLKRAWSSQPLALTGSSEWRHSRAVRLPRPVLMRAFLCAGFHTPCELWVASCAQGSLACADVGFIPARARCTELHQRFEQGACPLRRTARRQRAVLPSSPPCSPRPSARAAACHGDLSFSHLVVRRNRHSARGASRAARTVKGRGGGAQCCGSHAQLLPRRAFARRRRAGSRKPG